MLCMKKKMLTKKKKKGGVISGLVHTWRQIADLFNSDSGSGSSAGKVGKHDSG